MVASSNNRSRPAPATHVVLLLVDRAAAIRSSKDVEKQWNGEKDWRGKEEEEEAWYRFIHGHTTVQPPS